MASRTMRQSKNVRAAFDRRGARCWRSPRRGLGIGRRSRPHRPSPPTSGRSPATTSSRSKEASRARSRRPIFRRSRCSCGRWIRRTTSCATARGSTGCSSSRSTRRRSKAQRAIVPLTASSPIRRSARTRDARSRAGSPDSGLLECPCHESRYNPRDAAAVVDGPTPRALPALPLAVADGKLVVAKPFIGRPGVIPT